MFQAYLTLAPSQYSKFSDKDYEKDYRLVTLTGFGLPKNFSHKNFSKELGQASSNITKAGTQISEQSFLAALRSVLYQKGINLRISRVPRYLPYIPSICLEYMLPDELTIKTTIIKK